MGSGISSYEKLVIRSALKKPECHFHGMDKKKVLYLAKELEKQEHRHVRLIHLFCGADGAEALGELIAKNVFLRTLLVCSSKGDDPLTEKAFDFICKGLMANETLASFGMFYVLWTESHAVSIVQMIRRNKGLRELRIEVCSNEGALNVLEAVIEAGRIQKLQFSYCKIDAKNMGRMRDALGRNKTLHILSFEHEDLGTEGGCMFGQFLCEDATLEELGLADCNLGTDGVVSIVHALKQNKTLRRLSVGDNGVGPEVAPALAGMLQGNSVLEELNLGTCGIGTPEFDVLVEALLQNTTLKTLVVSCTFIESGKDFARLLANNSSLTKLHVHVLEDLECEGLTEIVDGLKENATLTELSLRRSGVQRDWAIRLAEALRYNSSLRVLDLRYNKLTVESMVALAEALVGHKSMTSLYIPYRYEWIEPCTALLMQGNGSLTDCGNVFEDVCRRNCAMHNKTREAVQALRVLRWRQGEDSILHMIAKEVVKLIGKALWDTRTEISVWESSRL